MTDTRESYARLVERMLDAEAHMLDALRGALGDDSKRWQEVGGNVFHVEIFRDADAVVVDDSLVHPGEGRAVVGIERFEALLASHAATGRVSDPGDMRFANRLGPLLGAIHALSLDADAQEARLRSRGTHPCLEELSLALHDALSRIAMPTRHNLAACALGKQRVASLLPMSVRDLLDTDVHALAEIAMLEWIAARAGVSYGDEAWQLARAAEQMREVYVAGCVPFGWSGVYPDGSFRRAVVELDFERTKDAT